MGESDIGIHAINLTFFHLFLLFLFHIFSFYSDPFVKLLLNNRLIYTSQNIKNNINPVWNEQCTIVCPLEVPLSQCTLVVEVYDYDNVSDHDLLGSATVTGKLFFYVTLIFLFVAYVTVELLGNIRFMILNPSLSIIFCFLLFRCRSCVLVVPGPFLD